MNLNLELTIQEAEVLLQFIDVGVKQIGLKAVNGAFVLQHKINAAVAKANQPVDTPAHEANP